MNTLQGANDHDKLADLANKTYKEQAVWFLNAFWDSYGQKDADSLYNHVRHMAELDDEKKAAGSSVDELQAHRFLEKLHETMTVQSMRDKLRSSGALGPNERPKRVPLIHYLIIHYNSNWHELVNAPQGSKEEIMAAQKMLDEVNSAFAESEARAREASEAAKAAKAAEAVAVKREAEAKAASAEAKKHEAAAIQAEKSAVAREEEATQTATVATQRADELRSAQEELAAALAELQAQEAAHNHRTEELKKASETGGQVSRNKAKNELAQHLGTDPLPLRRAKITQEAAVKKAEKAAGVAEEAKRKAEAAAHEAGQARAAAEEAREEASRSREAAEHAEAQAVKARQEAEERRQQAEAAKKQAEAALDEARRKVEEAEAYLEEAKKRLPLGSTWWLERDLHEAKKYLPKAKGGISK